MKKNLVRIGILICCMIFLMAAECESPDPEPSITITSPDYPEGVYGWPKNIVWEFASGGVGAEVDVSIFTDNLNLILHETITDSINNLDINCVYEPNTEYRIEVSNYGIYEEDTISDFSLFTAGNNPADELTMVEIPANSFLMGDSFNEGESNELPTHEVNLDQYYITPHEITQGEYSPIFEQNPSAEKGFNLPVTNVSWWDAVEYCNLKSEACGFTPCYDLDTGECDFDANGYRLPTEAEWEYAARGGIDSSDNLRYSGCNEDNELANYAWYDANADSLIHEAGLKLPNQLGLYDMSGNIAEWCNDWYGENYYSSSPSDDPTGPDTGDNRIIRGGAYNVPPSLCRVAVRGYLPASIGFSQTGFRVVRRAD